MTETSMGYTSVPRPDRFERFIHRFEHDLPLTPIRYDQPFDITPNLAALRRDPGDSEARRRVINIIGGTKGVWEVGLEEDAEGRTQLTAAIEVLRDRDGYAPRILSDTQVIIGRQHRADPLWDLFKGRLIPDEQGARWQASEFRLVGSDNVPALHTTLDSQRAGNTIPLIVGPRNRVQGLLFSRTWNQLHL